MRKFRHLMTMAALVLTGTIISACSDEDNAVDHPANGTRTYTVTTTLTIDGGAETRALNGTTGAKTFAPGDKIAVKYYKKNFLHETAISNELKSTDITEGGKKASFTVTLDNPDPNHTEVRYVYPAYIGSNDPAYVLENEQDGTLASLTAKFDYAEASGTIVHSGDDITLPAGLTLSNQLALAKFTFSDGTNDITASLKRLIIEDGTHTYVVTPKGTSDIWVAMYPVTTAQTITLTSTDDAQYYEKSVTGKTLAKNNIYPISVTTPVTTSNRTVPLTLEAKEEEGAVVKFKFSSAVTNPVEYRTYVSGTWSAWAKYTSEQEITLTTTGDKVSFRGKNANYCNHSHEASTISCTADCYLYGNMMSLVDATAFPVLKKLTEDHTFHNLFNGNSHVYNHHTRPILLPATELRGCCYQGMFSGCENLTVAPELPATELASHCYDAMFKGCSSLEHGPMLPATELVGDCYAYMFHGCGSLKSVTCLATENLDKGYDYGTNWMLAETGDDNRDPKPIFYKAPSAVWTIDDDDNGEDGIPNYWIVKDYNAHSLNISNPDVGQIIGNDGRNYDYATKPSGVIAVAKICDVNGEHGLALALTDEGQMNWSSAKAACEAHTPAFTNGTWKLATQNEWDYIIYTTNDVFRDGFSSVGGTNMQSDVYWSSTETPSNTSKVNCWDFGSSHGWREVNKDDNFYARACLAW